MPILPISCKSAPSLIRSTSDSGRFIALANASEYLETEVETILLAKQDSQNTLSGNA